MTGIGIPYRSRADSLGVRGSLRPPKSVIFEEKEKDGWIYRRKVGGKRWTKAWKLCNGCFQNAADLPSDLCPGCEAYREHQC